MNIHVWKGVLKIPIKLFYILVLIISFLVLLSIQLLHFEKRKQEIVCTEELPYHTLYDSQATVDGEHAGCSQKPTYFNTWKSCHECFRPMAENFSRNFNEIPRANFLYPRGPPNFFKPRKTKQQDFIRDISISPSSVCVDTCPYLLAIQLSVSDRFEERNTIRTTWGSVAKTKLWPHAIINADFQILFVLAHQSRQSQLGADVNSTPEKITTPEVMTRIKTEANRHGDILYLDMIDSYFNLTLKLMSALYWIRHHCPGTKFFLKVDADTFVNVPLLLDLVIYNEELLEFSVTGHIYLHERAVLRSGKWGVSKDIYPINMFPVYASGCAYIISESAMLTMLEAAPYVPVFPVEDAFITGMLSRVAHMQMFNLEGLFTHFKDFYWQRCEMVMDKKVVGTHAGGARAADIWAAILERNTTCFEEDYSSVFEEQYKFIIVD